MANSPKKKLRATVLVPGRTGDLEPVVDRRFESGDWPFRLKLEGEDADTWLNYLAVECGKRKWGGGGMAQLDPKENSGSNSIATGDGSQGIHLIWDRTRGGPLQVRAKPVGTPELSSAQVEEFFSAVTNNCRARVTEQVYRRDCLYYQGLPWKGELWLDHRLRLGPPSLQDEATVLGPRVVIVEATLDAISWWEASATFTVLLREVSVFLSVLLRKDVHPLRDRDRDWVMPPFATPDKPPEVRQPGYWERSPFSGMPATGISPAVPTVKVQRPLLERDVKSESDDREQVVPDDAIQLWNAFQALPSKKRKQFIQAASMWQASLWLWQDYRTLSFSLRVAACEALKHVGPEFEDRKIYHVVTGLLGRKQADRLQGPWFNAHEVRSRHLHAGEIFGSEFAAPGITSSFRDPAFDQADEVLWYLTSAAMIEWLKCAGEYSIPGVKNRIRPRRFRGWGRDTAILIGGLVLGWLLTIATA